MKSFWIIVVTFTTWVFSSSCTKQIYSHWQVMQSYHTKADVMKQFGQPDQIMIFTDSIKWLYNCSNHSHFDSTETSVKINGTYNTSSGINTASASVTEFSDYRKYVLFRFNKDDRVNGWQTSRVNFAQRKVKVLPTIAVVGVLIFTVAETIYLVDGFASWGSKTH